MTNNFIDIEPTNLEPRHLIDFCLLSTGQNKLSLVRLIKEVTGMRLRDAKDFIDRAPNGSSSFSIYMTDIQLQDFTKKLNNIAATSSPVEPLSYTITDKQKIRNRKIVSLGIGNKSDIINCIIDDDITSIHQIKFWGGDDIEKIREILIKRYSLISEENLNKILNNEI